MQAVKKYGYIDAVRGIAALSVLVVHCHLFGSNYYPFVVGNMMQAGAMGVQLFYIASAFTLFLSLSGRARFEKNPTLNFFIRRFFRIAPLYYLAVAYYLFQDGLGPRYWLGSLPGISKANIVSNFFFVHGVNPYWINSIVPGGWSISVEMMFYAIVPFLFKKIADINQAIRFLLLTIILKIVLDVLLSNWVPIPDVQLWNSFLGFYIFAQLPVFALGFILFFMVKNPESLASVDMKGVYAAALAFVVCLAIGFNVMPLVFALVFLILILGFSRYELPLFSNRFTRYVGKISFSVYLVHFALLHWMEKWGMLDLIASTGVITSMVNFAIRYAILVALSVLAGSLSFYLLEQPVQSLGKFLIGKLEPKTLTA